MIHFNGAQEKCHLKQKLIMRFKAKRILLRNERYQDRVSISTCNIEIQMPIAREKVIQINEISAIVIE